MPILDADEFIVAIEIVVKPSDECECRDDDSGADQDDF